MKIKRTDKKEIERQNHNKGKYNQTGETTERKWRASGFYFRSGKSPDDS